MKEVKETMTAEEAWEIAKQILFDEGISTTELEEIFGTRNHYAVIRDYTPQEAKEKIDDWKKSKEEVEVGDVLKKKSNGDKCIVIKFNENRTFFVMFEDGSAGIYDEKRIQTDFKKTGKHIDIEAVLKQLGE